MEGKIGGTDWVGQIERLMEEWIGWMDWRTSRLEGKTGNMDWSNGIEGWY